MEIEKLIPFVLIQIIQLLIH